MRFILTTQEQYTPDAIEIKSLDVAEIEKAARFLLRYVDIDLSEYQFKACLRSNPRFVKNKDGGQHQIFFYINKLYKLPK